MLSLFLKTLKDLEDVFLQGVKEQGGDLIFLFRYAMLKAELEVKTMGDREQLRSMIEQARHMVFFGGAGVSTESGIPDFRSEDGLYRQSYRYPPEVILSHSFFLRDPEEFFRFYREKMLCLEAKPNAAHRVLAALEKMGRLSCVITQNIDGLHQAAGSRRVLELHGSVHRNYCMECGKFYDVKAIADSHGIPRCSCGGIIKPDVVLYEEPLREKTIRSAVAEIQKADLLLVAGTSLSVYPAAGLIDYLRKGKLVLVNASPTSRDKEADLLISGKIGEVLSELHLI